MQRSRETSAVAKARYHDIDGAGRNKVVRRFFGLTDREMTSIQDLVTRWLDRQLGA